MLKDVNIISNDVIEGKIYKARIRYRQPLELCSIVKSIKPACAVRSKGKNKDIEIELHFVNPQKSVTPGQSAVIYDGETCIGGGVIV